MTYRLEKSPEADADTDEIFDYLAERSVPTGIRFFDHLALTLEGIRNAPDIGMHLRVEHPKLLGALWRRVDGFPNHLVFYRVEADLVIVLRILHGARNWAPLIEG